MSRVRALAGAPTREKNGPFRRTARVSRSKGEMESSSSPRVLSPTSPISHRRPRPRTGRTSNRIHPTRRSRLTATAETEPPAGQNDLRGGNARTTGIRFDRPGRCMQSHRNPADIPPHRGPVPRPTPQPTPRPAPELSPERVVLFRAPSVRRPGAMPRALPSHPSGVPCEGRAGRGRSAVLRFPPLPHRARGVRAPRARGVRARRGRTAAHPPATSLRTSRCGRPAAAPELPNCTSSEAGRVLSPVSLEAGRRSGRRWWPWTRW